MLENEIVHQPQLIAQPRERRWIDFLRVFAPSSRNETDLEAQICRPPQGFVYPQQPQRQAIADTETTVFIEKCQLILNG